MTPQALFLYLTQKRGVSEDTAQEVVIDFLMGKMDAAESIKAWAHHRALWRERSEMKREQGRLNGKGKGTKGSGVGVMRRTFIPMTDTLRSKDPDPLTWAERRQQIERITRIYREVDPKWDPWKVARS